MCQLVRLLQTPALWLIYDSQYSQQRILVCFESDECIGHHWNAHQKFRYYDRQTPHRSRGSIISNYTFFLLEIIQASISKLLQKKAKWRKQTKEQKEAAERLLRRRRFNIQARNSCK